MTTVNLIPVPGTDLYLSVEARPRRGEGRIPAETEWQVTDEAGEPVAFGVRANGPYPDEIASALAYEGQASSSAVGHVSVSQRSTSRGGGEPARALAFALRLAAEWMDAELEAAQPEIEARRVELEGERAERSRAMARATRTDERAGVILRGLSQGRPEGDQLRVRLGLDDGREQTGYVQEVREVSGRWSVVLDGSNELNVRRIERLEVRDGARYAEAWTRDQLRLCDDPDSYSADKVGLDPDVPGPGAFVNVPKLADERCSGDGIVAWQEPGGICAVLVYGKGPHPVLQLGSVLEDREPEPVA